jgi:proline dehydrogenase
MKQKLNLSFENTEIAFKHLSNRKLIHSYWLFKLISCRFLVKIGPGLTAIALKLRVPVKSLIKVTLFKQFCGGESMEECRHTIKSLYRRKVGAILDYSVEGEDNEQAFDATCHQIMNTITKAAEDPAIPLTVFKVTGLGRFGLLAKLDSGVQLTVTEKVAWRKVEQRVKAICSKAADAGIPVMIDAEESWIQCTIDQLAREMMRLFNRERPIVYNTYQLYRRDKLSSLKADFLVAQHEGFILAAKLVRGAYLEKERKRAAKLGYPSPIQPDKRSTDNDYHEALRFCISHIDQLALVVGTHNEQSCTLMVELMIEKGIAPGHPRVYFSQLLGMSDHLSFNLAMAGFNNVKYVPYGPIEAVLPYLFRRAEENTAISGQMSRELDLINREIKRRKI